MEFGEFKMTRRIEDRYLISFRYHGEGIWLQARNEGGYPALEKSPDVRIIEAYKITCSEEGRISFEKLRGR